MRLVGVHAHDLAVAFLSRRHDGVVDAAAAGEDDLGALGVPAGSLILDVVAGVEGVAVPVLHLHLDAHFLRGVLSALDEAIAKADDRRHVHAADVAQLGVAVLDHGVAREEAGLLLLIEDGNGVGGVAAFRLGVQHDKVHVRVGGLRLASRRGEQVAGQDDDLGAVAHGVVDLLEAGLVRVLAGAVVGVGQAVFLGVGHHALIGTLVEGLVVDVAHVGDQGQLVAVPLRQRGNAHQHHRQNQKSSKQFLHTGLSSFFHCGRRNAAHTYIITEKLPLV